MKLWEKKLSKKYGKYYLYNTKTGKSIWPSKLRGGVDKLSDDDLSDDDLRSVSAHIRTKRKEAQASDESANLDSEVSSEAKKSLENMPDNAILNIIEHLDYDLSLFLLSKRFASVIPMGNVANYIARKLVTCVPDHAVNNGMWLPDACVNLNVHRILYVVIRGAKAANVKPLRDAIMRLATNKEDDAHHALLVRAPFFRMIEHHEDQRITQEIKDAARELFDELRPSIESAIRSERIGSRHLYAKATDEQMRRLVDSIGLKPLKSYKDLAGAVVGYVRDHIGLRASRLLRPEALAAYLPWSTLQESNPGPRHVDVYGPLCFWDTSSVERADGIFSPPSALSVAEQQDADPEDITQTLPALARFSADLYWSTNKCTSLNSTFAHCVFNGRIGHLDVSRVKSMNSLFRSNSVFNQPLGKWDVSSVVDTEFMFRRAISFNQPLDSWRFTPVDFRGVRPEYVNLSKGRRMRHMFQDAISFNQPLESWNLTGVIDTSGMFDCALSFNQPLENWDVSKSQNMDMMFSKTPSFNQSLTRWAPAHLQHAYSMFFYSANTDTLPWLKQGLDNPGGRMRDGLVADVSEILASHISPDSLLADESPLAIDDWLNAYTEVFPRGYMEDGSLHHQNIVQTYGERSFFMLP
jgi:hypothetical protein